MTDPVRQDLLIELGCEELPPMVLADLARSFYEHTCAGLREAGIRYSEEESDFLYTPRRMTLRIARVADRQPDRSQERKGPSLEVAFDAHGKPTSAATGFARSVGKDLDELDTLRTGKGEWLHCSIYIPGKPLSEIIFPILSAAVQDLPIPRPMRWSDHEFTFVRPVHWLLALHGERVLDGELLGCGSDRLTHGHRIHSPGPHVVADPAVYEDLLRDAFVEVDHHERRLRIQREVEAAGDRLGGKTRTTDGLLDEVCNLVEWPVAVDCRFKPSFLEVPQEALIASMETHQKFFPVLLPETGELLPAFVGVANLESKEPGVVREGFERVVHPRLADARFFWEQDLQTPLEDQLSRLDEIVFQSTLGTIGDKTRRISYISQQIAESLNADPGPAERAARLSKCDLVTQMVAEFPELQGIMGAYYAAAAGESPEVSEAIRCHYQPRYAGDDIPPLPLGRIVAIADRMDTLAGIFAVGLRPSGNRDPYALRRAALGVIRILLEAELELTLAQLEKIAVRALAETIEMERGAQKEMHEFIIERLRHYLREGGATRRQINAVLAAPLNTLADLKARLSAVGEFMSRPEAESLIASNKRIGNILRQDAISRSEEIDPDLFMLKEEKQLFGNFIETKRAIEPLLERADYGAALEYLARLRKSVDRYFDNVMVMDEDPAVRCNRLAQLAQLKGMFDQVADFALAD